MNAFLFNTEMIMLASVTLVQFCADSFDLYTRFTGVDLLFNVGVKHLTGIKYVWYYYYWALLGFAVIGIIYLAVWPSDKKASEKGVGYDSKTNLPD